MSTRDNYLKEVKQKLDQWNKDIDKMEDKIKEAGSDVKDDYNKKLTALKKKRDEAQEKFKEMQDTTESVWDDVKDGFENTWKAISNTFISAKDKLFDK